MWLLIVFTMRKIVPTHLRRENSSYVHLSMVSTAISVKCLQTVCKLSANRLQTIYSIVTELIVVLIFALSSSVLST